MRKILGVIFLLLLINSVANAADNAGTLVIVGGDEGLDACTGLGVVSGLKPGGDGFLAVRSGADGNYKLLDKLPEGQEVHICSSASDGKWLGVVYSRKRERIVV